MPAGRKVSGCGTVFNLDVGSGFFVLGHCDSITPFGLAKAIVDLPTLDCDASSEIGREEQSTCVVTQYWDPSDTDHLKVDTNFEESKTDPTKKTIVCQYTTPAILNAAGSASAEITYEADVQIAEITPEAITPTGYYKRTITLLRVGPITRTSAAV